MVVGLVLHQGWFEQILFTEILENAITLVSIPNYIRSICITTYIDQSCWILFRNIFNSVLEVCQLINILLIKTSSWKVNIDVDGGLGVRNLEKNREDPAGFSVQNTNIGI
jgi:hypothetical protein